MNDKAIIGILAALGVGIYIVSQSKSGSTPQRGRSQNEEGWDWMPEGYRSDDLGEDLQETTAEAQQEAQSIWEEMLNANEAELAQQDIAENEPEVEIDPNYGAGNSTLHIGCPGEEPVTLTLNPPLVYPALSGVSITDPDIGKATVASITGGPDDRRPELTWAIAKQFCVGQNPRYKKRPWNSRGNRTFCTTYAEDVMRAMRANYLPHGLATANSSTRWLQGRQAEVEAPSWYPSIWRNGGPAAGWRKVELEEAIIRANQGFPVVVAAYINPTGHVGVLLPNNQLSQAGQVRPGSGLIAQAGASNFFAGPVSSGFGDFPREFFWHV